MVFRKMRLRVGQNKRFTLFGVDGILQIFFVQRPKDPSRQRRLGFVAIFIHSRDICAQTRKLS